jgi:hypothetical protein
LAAACEKPAECSREGGPKQTSERRSGWYSRARKDALLLQGNSHDIIGREELELLMTRSESRGANEDRHRSRSTGRAVIPLDAKVSYDIQQSRCRRASAQSIRGRRSLTAPLGHRLSLTAPQAPA